MPIKKIPPRPLAQTINSAHAVDGLPIIVTQLVLIGGGFPDVEFIMECEKLLPLALIGCHLWRIQATRLLVGTHALRDEGEGRSVGEQTSPTPSHFLSLFKKNNP